ncbi:MAG: hypothetical protein ACK5LN_05615 [Propioniciclava sp.]
MPRRVDLPGAKELFRTTGTPRVKPAPARVESEGSESAAMVTHSGRVRHDEKITVYVSSEELLALEQLRLYLRGELGIAADRGRIVRAAIASALEEVSTQAMEADVVRRLRTT